MEKELVWTNEDAIKMLKSKMDGSVDTSYEWVETVRLAINALEQQPKTGHWIADVDKWGDIVTTVNGYRCDKCNTFNTDKDNYCPNCGAKMEGEDE